MSNASPGRVVARAADAAMDAFLGHLEEAGVAARDDERDRRQRDLAVREERGRDVARDVMDRHERLAVDERDRLGGLQPDEQRADEPGPLRHRDRGEVLEPRAGVGHRLLHDGHDRLDVVARGELGHDAAVGRVQLGLARHHVREDAAAVLDDRGSGLVAGGLDPEHAGRGRAGHRPGATSRRRRSSRASCAFAGRAARRRARASPPPPRRGRRPKAAPARARP